MKRIYLVLATVMCIIGTGCKKSEKNAEQPTPTVDVALPVVDSITLHRTFPGYLHANVEADVVARASGTLLSKNYKDGQYVSKGQVLFTIQSTTYTDAVKQQQAALDKAKSQYDFYSRQYEAMKKALLADAVSQMDVVQAESNMKQAAASIATAEAALNDARTNLGYCTVRAPISGHISSSIIDVGNYVNGQGVGVKLATIYDDSSMVANFSIEDSQYEKLVSGEGGTSSPLYRAIPLTFNESLPRNYTADLYYSSPSIDTSTGTLTLKGLVQNPDGDLKDGMYVTVSLPYGTEPKAVLVKDASIGTDQLGKYLYVVNDSDKVVYTPIEVGDVYKDTLRLVTKGIKPTDRYVTKALLSVRNGEKVNPNLVK